MVYIRMYIQSIVYNEPDAYMFTNNTCLCVVVSDLQGASYLLAYVQYLAAFSLFEAGLQLSI